MSLSSKSGKATFSSPSGATWAAPARGLAAPRVLVITAVLLLGGRRGRRPGPRPVCEPLYTLHYYLLFRRLLTQARVVRKRQVRDLPGAAQANWVWLGGVSSNMNEEPLSHHGNPPMRDVKRNSATKGTYFVSGGRGVVWARVSTGGVSS